MEKMRLNIIDYEVSKLLNVLDIPFSALIGAAIMKADTDNLKRLRLAFPSIDSDLETRRCSWRGLISGDKDDGSQARAKEIAIAYITGQNA